MEWYFIDAAIRSQVHYDEMSPFNAIVKPSFGTSTVSCRLCVGDNNIRPISIEHERYGSIRLQYISVRLFRFLSASIKFHRLHTLQHCEVTGISHCDIDHGEHTRLGLQIAILVSSSLVKSMQ